MCSDGETFVSADDLRINLWHLEVTDQCFNVVDMKPADMEDLVGDLVSFVCSKTVCIYIEIEMDSNNSSGRALIYCI